MTGPYPVWPWSVLIGWPRSTKQILWSGGSWVTTYPIANSNSLPLGRVARSADLTAASTRMIGIVPEGERIEVVSSIAHNWSVAATWRIRIYADEAGTALAYDSGVMAVWPQVYADGELEWEHDGFWLGTYSQDELSGLPWNSIHLISPWVSGRRIEIDVFDGYNSEGYLQHGMIDVAAALRVPVNPAYGADAGWKARSISAEAEGGAMYWERRPKGRMFSGNVDQTYQNWARGPFFEFQRNADVTDEFLFIENPADALNLLRTSFLSRNGDIPPLKRAFPTADAVPVSFVEVL